MMKKLKNVHTFRDNTGKFRCYFRRAGGRNIPLPGKIGGPQFMAAYRRARSNTEPPRTARRKTLPTGPHVYFIEAGGFIKIGWASDLAARFQELQIASPVNLIVLLMLPGGAEREKRFHRMFGKLRVRGEWFTPGAPLLDFIASTKAEHEV